MVVYKAIQVVTSLIRGDIFCYNPESNEYAMPVKEWLTHLKDKDGVEDGVRVLVQEYLEILERFPNFQERLPALEVFLSQAKSTFQNLVANTPATRQQELLSLHNHVVACLTSKTGNKSCTKLPLRYSKLDNVDKYSICFECNPYNKLICKIKANLPNGEHCQDILKKIKSLV